MYLGFQKGHQFYLKMYFWRNSDVIMTSVLPFLLYFAAKIVKSPIQIVWKWPIPLFNMFSVRKNEMFAIFQILRHYDIIMSLLWCNFYHFSSEIIKSSIKIVWKWLISRFNVFWVKKNDFFFQIWGHYDFIITLLWRHYDVIFTISS